MPDGQTGTTTEAKNRSGSTNYDTLIGRVVVEQGLATEEEVQLCRELQRQRGTEDEKDRSLADLLVDNQFLTSRQLDRVRREVDAQRSTTQIPGYKIKKKLGAGAMASVYLAKQTSLDRYVAIKVLPPKFNSNEQFIKRFYDEGRAAAKLNHPNIVQAFDVNQSGDFHYFVMEFVEGRTVYDDIVKRGRYPEEEAIDIVLQIADALQHAHTKGFVHRDVKPKNIMITKEGVAKLADMGLARALSDKEAAEAEAGRAFGTPYYISPEQIQGKVDIGPQADIYSLGATFYHMVTGQVPFDGENPTKVMHKHLKADLVPPDHVNPKLTAGVSEVIEMMMAKSSRDRYRTAGDLIKDLRLVREGKRPALAHKEEDVDLSTIATGEMLGQSLEDTAVTPAIRSNGNDAVLANPAVLLLIVLLGISLLGNFILTIVSLSG